MDEFIFGTLANDALKVIYERAWGSGLRHAHRCMPLDAQPGESVELTVTSGPALAVTDVAVYYTTDGATPQGSRGVATVGTAVRLTAIGRRWDTINNGYATVWTGVLPGQAAGTVVRYVISGWAEGGDEVWTEWPDLLATTEAAARVFFEQKTTPDYVAHSDSNGAKVFELRFDTWQAPAWARVAVMYHIFVDRFAPGPGRAWTQMEDLGTWMGGTLWGVAEKLDYIAGLGVNGIWLSPVYPGPTYHGYDVTDYRAVDERYGGAAALRAVVDGAHARGLRVILDFVANHCSNQHPLFASARDVPGSPYREWFNFDDSPVGYRGFFGVATMPQFNLRNAEAAAWMIENGVYWLREFGVDGLRLDYASGPGPDFWGGFRAACKAVNPECFLFGEIVETPEVLRAYTGRLDGALDFYTAELLRGMVTGQVAAEIARTQIAAHRAHLDGLLLPAFVDNHDMNRLLQVTGNDMAKVREGLRALLALDGPVIVFYGTEVGLRQRDDTRQIGLEASREPMPWETMVVDAEIVEMIRGRTNRG